MTRQIQVLQVNLVDLEVPSTMEGIHRNFPTVSEFRTLLLFRED
jgi:hypothetical protein